MGSNPVRVTIGFKLPISLGIQVPQLGGFGSGTRVKVGAVVLGGRIDKIHSVFACADSVVDAYTTKQYGEWVCKGWTPALQAGYSGGFNSLILHH